MEIRKRTRSRPKTPHHRILALKSKVDRQVPKHRTQWPTHQAKVSHRQRELTHVQSLRMCLNHPQNRSLPRKTDPAPDQHQGLTRQRVVASRVNEIGVLKIRRRTRRASPMIRAQSKHHRAVIRMGLLLISLMSMGNSFQMSSSRVRFWPSSKSLRPI